MDKIIATKKWTSFDKDGNGHLFVEINGEDLEIDVIPCADMLDIDQLKERIDIILKINNIVIEEPKPVEKPKRKYTRHTTLGLASEYGKVTLKLAMPEKKFGWVLYLKGTKKFVFRFDEKGIYVVEEGGKTKPMIWSDKDIKLIKNKDDFDFVKVETRTNPKNRLS